MGHFVKLSATTDKAKSVISGSLKEIAMPQLWYCHCLNFRKSLKSLFFLLPLLGITNVLHFVWPNPLRGTWLSFAVWSFASHFLYSFQGFFVASVYFFFDDKVWYSTIPASFCLFLSFSHHNSNINWKSFDVVLGNQTRGLRMGGANGSTELWRLLFKFQQSL